MRVIYVSNLWGFELIFTPVLLTSSINKSMHLILTVSHYMIKNVLQSQQFLEANHYICH